ncbi:FecR family protein [Mesorhizobium sp. KR9-304]|uniref:FecR family protein n=1 Tax=Mesorhizobium sp. KR9-304 TaxID=3156614 RepID=UPI0032B3291A
MKTIASGSLLKAVLLGGVAFGSLLSGALQANAEVGVAAAVNIDAKGRPPGAAPRVITLGSNVVFNEEITTDEAGLVQILLLDGTTFTVGPNSQLTIDEFVYDPNTGDAKVVASLTRGVFRFVGARTSQTDGGATVKTPVGTIGIRGGVANFSCDAGECKASLVAGKSLTIVDGDGTKRIVYETGYTAVISKDPSGGTTTTVRKSTKDETGLIQKQLSSKPGQNGGNTGEPPSDEQAEQVAETNSGLPPTMDVPGSAKPVQSSEPDQVEEVAGIDGKTQDDLDNDIEEEEEEQPTVNARVLTVPAGGYVTDPLNGGGTVPDAGPRGLVGSTPDSDQNLLLTVQGDRLATSDGTTLDLPDFSGTSSDEGDVEGDEIYPELDALFIDGDATYLGQELGGYAYAGRGDFVAYMLGIGGDPTQPVYVIYGTPTANPQAIFTDSNVVIREYALTGDPIGPIEPVPFFRDDIYGVVNEYYDPDGSGGDPAQIALSSTNLIVVETDGGNDMRAYQSWVHISGEGDAQRSAAFLYTAGVGEDDDGNLQIDGGRRGTYRTGAYVGPVNMRGGAASIAGATGDHFFGENADHFVIGATPSPADHYSDVPLDSDLYTGSFDGQYGTHHVASLVAETPLTEYGQPGQPTRTTRDVTGFISGIGESNANANPYVLTDEAGPNITLHLDSETNTVRGVAELFDVLNQDIVADSFLIGFGRSGSLGGGSAFVDDDVFGAQKDNDPEKTRIRTDGGDDVAHTGQFTPGTYLVSGRANPIDGYQHLEGCESCDFIDWGWWGTRVEVAAGASDEITEDRVDYVHMGTWVAGDVSTETEIETLVAGTTQVPFGATVYYSGTVIGNVARETVNGTAQYIATGDLNVSYNFSSRSGGVNINNFDNNVYLSGSIGETDTLQSALIGGALSGDNVYTDLDPYDTLSGSFSGAFVNNPAAAVGAPNVAAGVIGNFDFTGASVNAVGTAAASFVNID